MLLTHSSVSTVIPAISLVSWGLPTHAELTLMSAMALLAMQNILLLKLGFFHVLCVVKLLNFMADNQEISVTNLTRSLKTLGQSYLQWYCCSDTSQIHGVGKLKKLKPDNTTNHFPTTALYICLFACQANTRVLLVCSGTSLKNQVQLYNKHTEIISKKSPRFL